MSFLFIWFLFQPTTEAALSLLFLLWRYLILCEGQEYLFQGRLMYRVIFNIILCLRLLHNSENLSEFCVVVGNLEIYVTLTAFKHGRIGKYTCDVLYQFIATGNYSKWVHSHATEEGVAMPELAFEMLWTAQTDKLSIDHDYYLGTKCITLLHTVMV